MEHEHLKNQEAFKKEIDDLLVRVEKWLEKLYKIKPLPVERLSKGENIKNDLKKLRRHFFTKDKIIILKMWVERLNENGVFLKTPLE